MSAVLYVPDYIHHPDPANIGATGVPLTGSGSPAGVVTPTYVGQGYIDLDVPQFYYADGLTSADWNIVAGVGGTAQVFSGAGSPVGVVTPTASTAIYIDTDNGSIWEWYSGAWH